MFGFGLFETTGQICHGCKILTQDLDMDEIECEGCTEAKAEAEDYDEYDNDR